MSHTARIISYVESACTWPSPSGLQDKKHPLGFLEGAFMFSGEGAARLANRFQLSQQSGYRFIRRERAAERRVALGFSARHLAYRWRGSVRA